MASASAVWFDAGEDVAICCGLPTRWHFNHTNRWCGCHGAQKVFELRHRLSEQLAASLDQCNREREFKGGRRHGAQSAPRTA